MNALKRRLNKLGTELDRSSLVARVVVYRDLEDLTQISEQSTAPIAVAIPHNGRDPLDH